MLKGIDGRGRKTENRINRREKPVITRFLRGQVSSIYNDLVATNTGPNRSKVRVLCIWPKCILMAI